MDNDIAVFDSHTHIGKWGVHDFFGRKIEPFEEENSSIEDYRSFLGRNCIKYSIVVPIYTPEKGSAFFNNKLVLECVSELQNVYGGLWYSPDDADEKHMDEICEHAGNQKIVVFKTNVSTWGKDVTIDPITWNGDIKRRMESLIDTAIRENIVFQFHTAFGKASPGHFHNFLKEYGKSIKIQFVHMGLDVWTHFQFVPLFIDWISSGYDVYCDTSLARGFAVRWLIRLLEKEGLGIRRVLFASDEPWGDFTSETWKIRGLQVDAQCRDMLLYSNAVDLYLREAQG